jgi:hypothetical protein
MGPLEIVPAQVASERALDAEPVRNANACVHQASDAHEVSAGAAKPQQAFEHVTREIGW